MRAFGAKNKEKLFSAFDADGKKNIFLKKNIVNLKKNMFFWFFFVASNLDSIVKQAKDRLL